jgi:PhnB protein
MAQNPPKGYPRLMPYLLYADSNAAIDFLTRAFGFREKYRMTGDDGRVNHAELELDDAVVMLGTPGSDYKNPKALGSSTCSIYSYIDDVDAHFERAREAGAAILREPEDQFYGDRSYGAADPEGHEWYFATHVRDVDPSEFASATAGAAT